MSQEKLRALLAEARTSVEAATADFRVNAEIRNYRRELCERIDAALSEPVEGCARCEETEHAMHLRIRADYDKTVADSWRAHAAKIERERDEARAEVERLSRLIDRCAEGFEAVRRSNHARGHAAADEMLAEIRALPVPGDKS